MLKKVEDIVDEYLESKNADAASESLKALMIPERFICYVFTSVLNKAMDRNGMRKEKIIENINISI